LGPFFPREFAQGANDLTIAADGAPAGAVRGEVIEITGRVVQADGAPLDNLVLEIWQANAEGRYDDPAFFGWGRAATDANGVYRFRTIRPGAPAGRAPHVNFVILFSGLMRHLQTVMFFEDAENGADPVLNAVQPPERRRLLVAKKRNGTFTFDIRLRGEGETPFFGD
ncbi:MAG TPA: protocatechuate 3,4-dioxygenase subunit alpha, partial [Burkholderiales bacterium]|nr:protocatechuate 3,4-dioxygenase subunit alpha [Burkholderiales bacterium]